MDVMRVLSWVFAERSPAPSPVGPDSADDWASVEDILVALDADALAYGALKRRGELDTLPTPMRERMQRSHTRNTLHNLELVHHTRELLDAFHDLGIGVRPLKGAHLLLEGVHRDIGVRRTVDIDLLTAKADRRRVTEALEGLGYRTDGVGGLPKHLPAYRREHTYVEVHEFAYWGKDGRPITLADFEADEEPLARTFVHLLHHLFVSSITEPWLVVKTLADMREIRRAAPSGSPERPRSLAAAAGLEAELRSLSSIDEVLADVQGSSPDSACIGLLRPMSARERRRSRLAYLIRSVVLFPPWYRRAALRSTLIPSRSTMEAIYGLPHGSHRVWAWYLGRPGHLLAQAARAVLGIPSRGRRRAA